jgi:membrane-associated phospholipid phosphatase
MALIALLIISLLAGFLVVLAASRLPRSDLQARTPHVEAGAKADPEAATGLALTLALLGLVAGGVVLAVLTFVVRGSTGGLGVDRSAASWGHRHGTTFTSDVLDAITHVGQPSSIAALAIVLAIVETVRTRNRWIAPFLLIVVAGNGILTTTIKHLADRVRPTLNPIAETLGPSFPSGHSSWSAAFFAAAALVLARGRGRQARIALAALAAALAVMIASTRVLLAVHWLSDVIAGLALGWAWFAACSIAFGGRLLRFGATAEVAGVGRAAPEVRRGPREAAR